MVHKIEVEWVGCQPVCGCGQPLTFGERAGRIVYAHAPKLSASTARTAA